MGLAAAFSFLMRPVLGQELLWKSSDALVLREVQSIIAVGVRLSCLSGVCSCWKDSKKDSNFGFQWSRPGVKKDAPEYRLSTLQKDASRERR